MLGLLLLPMGSEAATYDWNVTSGTWTTGGGWLSVGDPGNAPATNTAGDIINLTNGTSGTPAEATFSSGWFLGAGSSITINADNKLTLSSGATLFNIGAGSALTNHGIIQSSSTSGLLRGGSGTRINDGTIQALSGGSLSLWDFGSIENSSGTIQATTGGTLIFLGSATIENGILKSESGGFISQGGPNPGQNVTLTGVAVDNQGTFISDQATTSAGAGSTTLQLNLGSGTIFTNAGTTKVMNTGSGDTTSGGVRGSLFNVNSGATFTNSGTLLIQNDATRTGSTTGNTSVFTVVSGATAFTSSGTISVINNSTATAAAATFTSAKAFTNGGVVQVKGNSVNAGASFSITGGNSYTQSGGGTQRTVLEQGGLISANTFAINSGTFGGVGTVTGATTIGSASTLVAGDTYAGTIGAGVLTFNDTLDLANDSEVKFGLGLNTAASSQIVLVGASNLTVGSNVTLTLSDLTAGNWVDGTTYRLFDLGAGSISSTSFVVNFTSSGWEAVLSTGATGTDFLDVTLHAVASVPEPSSYAMIGGAVALLCAVRRRKSRA